jgi:23S rRNA pseudouridine2605 synthase
MNHKPGRRVQLHRAVAKLGWGSRQQAVAWIRAGEIEVDGLVVREPLTWIDLDLHKITRLGKSAAPQERVVLALHKPRRIVTTRSDELNRRTVYDLLPEGMSYLFPVGRLDADSEGLLIMTNDASLAVRLTEPSHAVRKTYRVTVVGRPDDEALRRLREGVELSDGPTRPVVVRIISQRGRRTVAEMVLTEGRNRQVRRMWASVGHKVRRLMRVAIGGFLLGDLTPGASIRLETDDIERLINHT